MKSAFYLVPCLCFMFYMSILSSCTNKMATTTVHDTLNSQQIDPYEAYKPTMMVWNDTGNSTYWSRCWIHHFTYNSTGQLTNIFVKVFDSDSATSKPDSIFYTLTYDNKYSIYPSQYTFSYYGAGRGILTNDVHQLISDQQVVYLDTAIVGIRYPGGDTLEKCQYTYANGKMTVTRTDFKDSSEYLISGDKLLQINDYTVPSYSLSYQFFYTYTNNTTPYINPFWYVKVYKYLHGNGYDGISKYLPETNAGIYPNSSNYNFNTTYTYTTDTVGRVTVAKSNNTRERTTTVYSY